MKTSFREFIGIQNPIALAALAVIGVFTTAYVVRLVYRIVMFAAIMVAFTAPTGRRMDQRVAEEFFVQDYEQLRLVADYFESLIYDDISIRFFDSSDIFVSATRNHRAVSNPDVSDALETLRGSGYSMICKRGSAIIFLHQVQFDRHFGNGIVYFIDDSLPQRCEEAGFNLYNLRHSPTSMTFLTLLKPLSAPNWFYYEEDFRYYRIRYRN